MQVEVAQCHNYWVACSNRVTILEKNKKEKKKGLVSLFSV